MNVPLAYPPSRTAETSKEWCDPFVNNITPVDILRSSCLKELFFAIPHSDEPSTPSMLFLDNSFLDLVTSHRVSPVPAPFSERPKGSAIMLAVYFI